MRKKNRPKRISLKAAEKLVDSAEEGYVHKKGSAEADKGIEPKIRSAVIALTAHGFPTQNSCEGHLGSNLYPWVRFEPATTGDTKRAVRKHLKNIHKEVKRLRKLLGKFWESRPSLTPDRELVVELDWDPTTKSDRDVVKEYLAERAKRFVALPGYRLQCSGARSLWYLPDELVGPHRTKILKHRQEDMLAFTQFLASKL